MKPGQAQKYDYEYQRNGTCNMFLFFQPLLVWRHVEVTEQRTKLDFALCMKALTDEYFPEEARRILKKLNFHYTPKHGSWLNMV